MNEAVLRRSAVEKAPLLVLAISVATLAAAYGSQYLGGLEPCQLCLYQRWPWWAAIGLSGLAVLPTLPAAGQRTLLLLAGIVILGGAAIALFHVGVEQKWWAGPASCGGGGQVPASLQDLQDMMQKRVVPCDTPAWTLLGVSMAGYNALLSLAVGAGAVFAGIAALRRGQAGQRR